MHVMRSQNHFLSHSAYRDANKTINLCVECAYKEKRILNACVSERKRLAFFVLSFPLVKPFWESFWGFSDSYQAMKESISSQTIHLSIRGGQWSTTFSWTVWSALNRWVEIGDSVVWLSTNRSSSTQRSSQKSVKYDVPKSIKCTRRFYRFALKMRLAVRSFRNRKSFGIRLPLHPRIFASVRPQKHCALSMRSREHCRLFAMRFNGFLFSLLFSFSADFVLTYILD